MNNNAMNSNIMFARYLESLNHRLNETLDIIKEHLPVEELEYDQCGKPIFPCCWPLVKILIEINVTAKKLMEGEPEKDDTDSEYSVAPEWVGQKPGIPIREYRR